MHDAASHVVVLQGSWLDGAEATIMGRRLSERHRFDTRQLNYRTARASLKQNVQRLREFVEHELRPHASASCHFVGHSLGGLIILQMLADCHDAPSGRVVLLGTPLSDSNAAERLASLTSGRSMLGSSIASGDAIDCGRMLSACVDRRDVGMIAGTMSVGQGERIADLPRPNDGSVTTEETSHERLTDHLRLAATHTTLVTSREVIDQVAGFLKHGRFDRARHRR